MVSREHVLAEIRRTAEENGGKPLGKARFAAVTGIRETDWSELFPWESRQIRFGLRILDEGREPRQ
jgi:hypothetical protein